MESRPLEKEDRPPDDTSSPRSLPQISYEEWEAIPEIGDYTIKKKNRFESFTPVPDTLLAKAAAEKARLLLTSL